ncbi:hypothetical protein JR316_0003454 [Psilocybe cubensis]|uniref:Uncharacterized protein n=2 Tax=Psilocybe cubensis TaxID=181762 RepID=A0ACB8H7Y2_PSICU|nr:hypothetical protein JR316_0003454 [Psilocybe cubensis]KAH9483976.1 hypothetical protein JR316_0003454 [Psilocybe cubensis]
MISVSHYSHIPPDPLNAPRTTDIQQPDSPTLSHTIALSCTMASAKPQFKMTLPLNPVEDDSDDEIVWGVSDDSLFNNSSGNDSDDSDYVIIKQTDSEQTNAEGTKQGPYASDSTAASVVLEIQMNDLTLDPRSSAHKKKSKKKKKAEAGQSTPQALTNKTKRRKGKPKAGLLSQSSPQAHKGNNSKTSVHPAHSIGDVEWFEEMAVSNLTGLGARSIVDDYSDRLSVVSYDESDPSPTLYEEASTFISSFLSNPDAKKDNVCKLALLQSLIIELGLATPSLPDSLSAAKAFLRSRAFLNIREYIAVREQGPEAVQRVLYPTKSALIKDIKKTRKTASLKWVKQHGLQVLLVGWTH